MSAFQAGLEKSQEAIKTFAKSMAAKIDQGISQRVYGDFGWTRPLSEFLSGDPRPKP